MTHLTEDEFVLLHYGDAGPEEERKFQTHIAACKECSQEFERLHASMSAIQVPAPEPAEGYEECVWLRLRPMLPEQKRHPWAGWQPRWRWATAAAMVAVIFAAFSMGRWFERSAEIKHADVVQPAASADSIPVNARERALLIAVGAHLERVQIVLIELANASPTRIIDISDQQETIRSLLPDNRLYRQTATQLADVQVATLLDEVERLLMDVSHRPRLLSTADLKDIRDQIQGDGLLFKVRITGAELRTRQGL